MVVNLEEDLLKNKLVVEKDLAYNINNIDAPEELKESMLYSLMAGGKRLRPILLILSYEAYENKSDKIMSSATALEMIHTYSLIHDDLPAMDNDDFRRGKKTNHKQFDEATAILAGDALLTHSFDIIANDELLSAEEKVNIIQLLAKCSGPSGMVAGQIYDMQAEKQKVNLEALERVHHYKTGELIKFAIVTGAYLANATQEDIKHLENFAYYLGLIFQIQDDILDVVGDEEKLGKPVGSDELNEKSTFPNLLGLEGAIKQKQLYINKARTELEKTNAKKDMLDQLMEHFGNRDH